MSLDSLSVNRAEWTNLRQDDEYCISRVPLIHFHDAYLKYQIDRLPLEPGDEITEGVIARYNGTGPAADIYGSEVMGAFRLYEQQNAALRAR